MTSTVKFCMILTALVLAVAPPALAARTLSVRVARQAVAHRENTSTIQGCGRRSPRRVICNLTLDAGGGWTFSYRVLVWVPRGRMLVCTPFTDSDACPWGFNR